MKLYRYKIMANLMEWFNGNVDREWTETRIIIAETIWSAMDKFENEVREECPFEGDEDYDLDIDDIRGENLGPADVFLSVRRSSYSPDMETLTIEELIEQLERFFDPKAKIYLADYSGIVAQYGGIDPDCIKTDKEEECYE